MDLFLSIAWFVLGAVLFLFNGVQWLIKSEYKKQYIFYGIASIFFGLLIFIYGYITTVSPVLR